MTTPGNWTTIPKGDWHYIHSDHDGTCIAVVTPKPTREETTADANVLAASKDLLDACEYAVSMLQTIPASYLQSFEDHMLGESVDFDKLDLAINKAKGEG